MFKHLRHLFTRKENEGTQTMLLPPAVGTDRKPCSTSLFPFALVTGVKPSPAFHRDLWYIAIKTEATDSTLLSR